MRAIDDDVKQALGQVARLAGFNVKRMATTDDLKDHVITITIVRPSEGWHQERLQFEDDLPLTASVNGRGEVVAIEHPDTGDPDDYNEVATVSEGEQFNEASTTVETGATSENTAAGVLPSNLHIESDGTVAEGAEQEGTVVELTGKKRK